MITAYAPSLQMRVTSRATAPGWQFELALDVLRRLDQARQGDPRGLSLASLSKGLRTDPLQLEPLLELLAEIDWVSRLDEGDDARHVLLCDPATTVMAPLVRRTLLAAGKASAAFRLQTGIDDQMLDAALGVSAIHQESR